LLTNALAHLFFLMLIPVHINILNLIQSGLRIIAQLPSIFFNWSSHSQEFQFF